MPATKCGLYVNQLFFTELDLAAATHGNKQDRNCIPNRADRDTRTGHQTGNPNSWA
jgi:hypothetical protein